MIPPLKLTKEPEERATFRDCYPFPCAAASAMTPTSPKMKSTTPLRFPLSHPENGPGAAPPVGMPGGEITRNADLVRDIEATLDRMTSRLADVRNHLDSTFPFRDDDDDRPRAA